LAKKPLLDGPWPVAGGEGWIPVEAARTSVAVLPVEHAHVELAAVSRVGVETSSSGGTAERGA